MQHFVTWVNRVNQVVGVTAALMVVVAVGITCQMIFIRYVLNGSTAWQTETVIYLVLGATMLGMGYVQRLNGHVNVDLVAVMLPPGLRKGLLIVAALASIVVVSIMTFYGYEMAHIAWVKNWTSDTVNAVPLWIPYSVMPLGFGLFALQLVADLIETLETPAESIELAGGGH